MVDDHKEEDGRCAWCYEEWPCAVSLGQSQVGRLGEMMFKSMATRADYKIRAARQVTDRINELFQLLGYPLIGVGDGSRSVTLRSESLLNLLERLYEHEQRAEQPSPEVG